MTVLLALNFFDHMLDNDLRYAPSFDYKIGDSQNEMDFGIISTEMFREVETIFGESKSGASLNADERAKLNIRRKGRLVHLLLHVVGGFQRRRQGLFP